MLTVANSWPQFGEERLQLDPQAIEIGLESRDGLLGLFEPPVAAEHFDFARLAGHRFRSEVDAGAFEGVARAGKRGPVAGGEALLHLREVLRRVLEENADEIAQEG